jgi:hypothetical protein
MGRKGGSGLLADHRHSQPYASEAAWGVARRSVGLTILQCTQTVPIEFGLLAHNSAFIAG